MYVVSDGNLQNHRKNSKLGQYMKIRDTACGINKALNIVNKHFFLLFQIGKVEVLTILRLLMPLTQFWILVLRFTIKCNDCKFLIFCKFINVTYAHQKECVG